MNWAGRRRGFGPAAKLPLRIQTEEPLPRGKVHTSQPLEAEPTAKKELRLIAHLVPGLRGSSRLANRRNFPLFFAS